MTPVDSESHNSPVEESPSAPGGTRSSPLTSLFLWGSVTLAAELLWARALGQVVGSDGVGAALSVSVFLAGGGVGYFCGARRNFPGIAVLVALLVGHAWALLGLPHFTAGWNALSHSWGKFTACLPFAVAPMLLGARVPQLLRISVRGALAQHAGRAFAALDLGSAAAAIATPLLVLPIIGVNGAAVAITAIACWALYREPHSELPAAAAATEKPSHLGSAGVAAFLVGAIAFATQVIWIRLLGEILGTTLLLLGMSTAIGLLGAGGAAAFLGRCLSSCEDDSAAKAEVLTMRWIIRGWWGWCVAQAVAIAAISLLPQLYLWSVETLGAQLVVVTPLKVIAIAVVALPASFASGLIIPALALRHADNAAALSRRTGFLGGVSLLGGGVGAGVGGVWFVWHWGSHATLGVLVGATAIASCATALRGVGDHSVSRRTLYLTTLASGISVAIALLLPWDPLVGAGVFQWNRQNIIDGVALDGYRQREILYSREGRLARVSIERSRALNTSFLKVGGRVEGTSPVDPTQPSLADLPTEFLLGMLPTLFAGEGGTTLVIGVGGGTTVSAAHVAAGGGVTALEVEPRVLDALRSPAGTECFPWEARTLFGTDAPPQIIIEDGRAFLHRDTRRWKGIVCQPSEPWLPWSAPLFTPEFYQHLRTRLEPAGVAVQWLQLYRIREQEFAAILQGFQEAFDKVWIFHPHPRTQEVILLGSSAEFPGDWADRWQWGGIRECRTHYDWPQCPVPLLVPRQVGDWLHGRGQTGGHLRERLEFWLPLLGDRGEDHSSDLLRSLEQMRRR